MEKEFTELSNYKVIQSICEDALANHLMIGVIGNPGLGKTVSLTAFKQKKQKNVIYVTAQKSMTPKLFLTSVFKCYTGEIISSSIPANIVLKMVVELFSRTNEKKLLIIDDAQKITPKMLKYLNEIRNSTKNNNGIVLSSLEYFRSNLEKRMNLGNTDISEFYNNINYWQVLSVPTKDDILLILKKYGITDKDFIAACLSVKSYSELIARIKKYLYNKSNNAE